MQSPTLPTISLQPYVQALYSPPMTKMIVNESAVLKKFDNLQNIAEIVNCSKWSEL